MIAEGNWPEGDRCNSGCLESDCGSWKENYEQSDLAEGGECAKNFVVETWAWRRNGEELESFGELDEEVFLHNLLGALQQATGKYKEDVVRGGRADLHCDSRRHSETVELIAKEGDTVDNNVDIGDEEDGERDYEVVDYSGSLGQNADRERREGLAEQRALDVLHWSHRDTFLWEDEYASSVNQAWAGQVHQVDAANDHSTRSDVVSDELKL